MNHQKLFPWMIGFALAAFFLSACGAPQTPTTPTDDPFAYCASVGTIDAPDARYAGPKVPEVIVKGLRKEAGIGDEPPEDWIVAGTVWRCMDGNVWACFVGANLPCSEKADTSRTPTSEMEDFCKDNPTSDVIPAATTGRATVYEWRCTNGAPEIVKQVAEPDAQGFLSHIWYEIKAQ
jgi:hypothetical protein